MPARRAQHGVDDDRGGLSGRDQVGLERAIRTALDAGAAFDRQGITPDDLIDFTPALKAAALQALEGFKIGPIYTPAVQVTTGPNAAKGTIQVPGYGGGANWQSGAADPETGFVYVGSNTSPTGIGNTPNPNAGANPDTADYNQATAGIPQIQGLRLLKPPYGRITGYDMNQGTIAFTIPNGDTPPNIKAALEAAGVKDAPPTGSPSQAHLLVTKNFLFATEGSGGQAILHAYDKKTGAPIWQGNMPSGPATGIPMGYSYQGQAVHPSCGPRPARWRGADRGMDDCTCPGWSWRRWSWWRTRRCCGAGCSRWWWRRSRGGARGAAAPAGEPQ